MADNGGGIGWNFPPNGNGNIDGLNDAGIETYAGEQIKSLVREIIQNSLDAKDVSSGRPVEIVFEHKRLPRKCLPDIDDFESILQKCRDFSEFSKQTEAVSFFEDAIRIVKQEEISVLKISDFHTTGLLDSDKECVGDWSSLIKSTGVSSKGGVAKKGGSYGIGKNAPFVCSALRTVFYLTKDKDGKKAFQGKSILATYEKATDTRTQGIGYWGRIGRNSPLAEAPAEFPEREFFTREENGTDLFIFGFNEEADWIEKSIKAVLDNFLVALNENRLIVRIGGMKIESTDLQDLVNKYCVDDDELPTKDYFDCLTSGTSIVNADFNGMGSIELILKIGKGLPKSVGMFRSTGMKIFDKNRFHMPTQFAGVFIARGDELNKFLRKLEPPGHDKWTPDRAKVEERRTARMELNEMYDWVKKQINDLAADQIEDTTDIEGISRYLPYEDPDAPSANPDDVSEPQIDGGIVDIVVTPVQPTPLVGRAPDTKPETHKPNPDGPDVTWGPEGSGGGGGGEGRRGGGGGGGSVPGAGEEGGGDPSLRKVRLKGTRVICPDPSKGAYTILFTPSKDSESGRLEVCTMGESKLEDAGDERADILSAKDASSGEPVVIKKPGVIGPIKFQKGVQCRIEIELLYKERCALGVVAFED